MIKKVVSLNLKVLAGIVILIVIIQLISAYALGFVAQDVLEKQFNDITKNNPMIKVVSHSYHRGIFSADSTTELTVNSSVLSTVLSALQKNESAVESSTNETFNIKYTTHIEHGFFAGSVNGYFYPTLAFARTQIVYQPNVSKILSKFFDKKTPLVIDNIVYLDKAGRFEVKSPSFSYDEALSEVKVIWQGLDLQIKYNKGFDTFTKQLSVPLFELSAPTKGTVVLKNLQYNSSFYVSKNDIKVGDTSLQINQLSINWEDKINLGFKLGKVLHNLTGVTSAELLNGIDVIDPNSVEVNNLSYATLSRDEDDFFSSKAIIHFDTLITNKKKYGPFDMNFSLDHIYSPAFSKLIDSVESMALVQSQTTDEEEQEDNNQILIKDLKKHFTPIFINSPVAKLDTFKLNTPDGLIDISGLATTRGFESADIEEQKKFMKKLVVNMHFSLPKPVLSYLLVLQMKYLLSSGNAQMDAQSSEALTKVVNILLDNQLNVWLKKGYLTNQNDILSTDVKVESGVLYLNGKVSE